MKPEFHIHNRQNLYAALPDGALAVLFSGTAPRQSADAYYPFFCNRNSDFVLLARKAAGKTEETLYILPKDPMKERWTGRRPFPEEVQKQSGISDIRTVDAFLEDFHRAANSGQYDTLWLDLFQERAGEAADEAHRFAARAASYYPFLQVRNLLPQLKRQRTFKQPCEIAAMQKAVEVTKAGILAMMRASHPGMYEYEYKAEFDYALSKAGVLTPAFPSIISAGQNNFCIHYYSYTGQAQDGDMILNDVGAWWDNEVNDVSRGWPCNGKFTKAQAALYTCAYQTRSICLRRSSPACRWLLWMRRPTASAVNSSKSLVCCSPMMKLASICGTVVRTISAMTSMTWWICRILWRRAWCSVWISAFTARSGASASVWRTIAW